MSSRTAGAKSARKKPGITKAATAAAAKPVAKAAAKTARKATSGKAAKSSIKASAKKSATSKRAKAEPRSKPESHSSHSSYSSVASGAATLSSVAGQFLNWADKLSDIAGPVANMSIAIAKSQLGGGGKTAAIMAAGKLLRQAREAVGMTAQEVGQAIDLKDPALLEQAETGKAALPFEVILRLAGVLGRHDPISFALNLTRSYNPELWAALDSLGLGKLAVQAGRERELANIYRRRDAARQLNDKEFAALLALVGSAFDMGLEFRNQQAT